MPVRNTLYAVHENESVAYYICLLLLDEVSIEDAAANLGRTTEELMDIVDTVGLRSEIESEPSGGIQPSSSDENGTYHDAQSRTRVEGLVNKESTYDPSEDEASGDSSTGRTPLTYSLPHERWVIVEATADAQRQIKETIPSSWTDAASELDIPVVIRAVETSIESPPQIRWLTVEYPTVDTGHRTLRPNVRFDEFKDFFPVSVDGVVDRESESPLIVKNIPVISIESTMEYH